MSDYHRIKSWIKDNPARCGNCRKYKSTCPNSQIDVGRMVRIYTQPYQVACPLWEATAEYSLIEQSVVLAKLSHTF